jgi:hypothetical protein
VNNLLNVILLTFLGLYLRLKILSYFSSPETKAIPINVLLWLDQVNGLFFAAVLSLTIAALVLPFPIRDFFGDDFCVWVRVPAGIHLSGTIIWSCFTGRSSI